MSIASEITRLQTAKADIKTAIEAKGVTVPSSAKLDTYDTYVASIPTGGSSKLPQVLDGSVTTLSASDIGNITSLNDYAFHSQTNLSSVTLPSTLTSIGKNSFYGCTSLTSITIPSSVTSIGASAMGSGTDGTFYKSGLTSLVIPNTVTALGGAFARDCASLTSITLPTNSGVTSLAGYALGGCTSLTSIIIPDNIYNFSSNVFAYDSALTSVTLPTNSNFKTISTGMFSRCTSLASLTIPSSITNIQADAFSYASQLTALDYQGTMAEWNAINKNSNWKRNSSLTTIHCSDGDITL